MSIKIVEMRFLCVFLLFVKNKKEGKIRQQFSNDRMYAHEKVQE